MKIKELVIIDFHFFEGIKSPRTTAMVRMTLEGSNQIQVFSIDLEPEETNALIQLARVIEHRLLTGDYPVSPETKRKIGFDTEHLSK